MNTRSVRRRTSVPNEYGSGASLVTTKFGGGTQSLLYVVPDRRDNFLKFQHNFALCYDRCIMESVELAIRNFRVRCSSSFCRVSAVACNCCCPGRLQTISISSLHTQPFSRLFLLFRVSFSSASLYFLTAIPLSSRSIKQTIRMSVRL